MKEKFEAPELEVVRFETEDIITKSGGAVTGCEGILGFGGTIGGCDTDCPDR